MADAEVCGPARPQSDKHDKAVEAWIDAKAQHRAGDVTAAQYRKGKDKYLAALAAYKQGGGS